mmetsp:Transcript_4283/g.27292  ORF Transcript_4283/g.27292 Transcript_4283/m.27292 type:complete len:205 (+) Transcript_4283:1750-2364(+)
MGQEEHMSFDERKLSLEKFGLGFLLFDDQSCQPFQFLKSLFVFRPDGHFDDFSSHHHRLRDACKGMRLFHSILAAEVVEERFLQDSRRVELPAFDQVGDRREQGHHDTKRHQSTHDQCRHVSFFGEEELGQGHSEGACRRSVRVSIFFVVFSCHGIGERFVGLGDLGGEVVCRCWIWIFVWMIDQGQLAIGSFDLSIVRPHGHT